MDQAEEWLRLGVDAHAGNRLPQAENYYRQALRIKPRHAVATQNLAVLFAQTNQLNEGLLTIERAAIFDGDTPIIHANRALMNLDADRIEEALAAAKHAVSISLSAPTNPIEQSGFVAARLALAMVCATAGMPERSVPLYNEILAIEPANSPSGPNAAFVQTLTAATPAELLAQRRKWYDANRYTGPIQPHDNGRNPDRPPRVGYVSGDFKRHSAAMIFGAVLLHHTAAIEPYFYSTLPVDPNLDTVTKQFQTAAGPRWRDISNLSDADADALIRRDRIDILVDLSAHTGGGRLALFTRKPAPIQVTAWGFAHGTALPEIDYFFADPVAVPPAERQHYAERIFDLPCIVSYLPPVEYNLKSKSVLPYHANEFITFGSYARYEKLSDQCLAMFAEILRRVPDSRLQFKDHAYRRPYSIRRVLAAMPDIDPSRLLFSISTSHPDHLSAIQQCDLCLDTTPHGGGAVALETLYMGVPLVTLRGGQPSGRTAASVLTAMNRTDWIADTPEAYIELAVRMSQDIPLLNRVRKTLRDEFLNSPVVAGYPTAVETAYQQIWREWCRA